MKKFLKGLFSNEDENEEVEMTQSEIKKENDMIRQREKNCEQNLKMIRRINVERFENINKIKPDITDRDIRLVSHRRSCIIYVQCSKCLSVAEIRLQELMTEDEFMKIINVECNRCNEVFERLTNEYNEKIEKEERIIENTPVGSRVRVYNHNDSDKYSFGTIVEYKMHDKNNVKFGITNSGYRQDRLSVRRWSYNTVIVMFDKGLEYITCDLNCIEKYDNRLTQSEIEYITSLLERHSIDNYASASIVSMNKEIISKISIDK